MAVAGGNLSGAQTIDKVKDLNSEHLRKSMSQIVSEIRPDEFPLDTLIRQIGKTEKAIDWIHNYQEATYRGSADAVDGAWENTSGTATEAVIVVDDPTIWEVNDTGLFEDAVADTNGDAVRFTVKAKASDGKLTIVVNNGSTSAAPVVVPDIPNNSKIYRLGTAASELAAQHQSNILVPANKQNYIQRFITQVERSTFDKFTQSRSGWNFQDSKYAAMYDYRSRIEASILNGKKGVTKNASNEPVYLTEGIIPSITQSIEFGTGGGAIDPDVPDIIDALEILFSGNAGSSTRWLFAGKKLISGLDKITKYDRNLESAGMEIVHGIKTRKLVSSFGEVYVKHHKTLDNSGLTTKGLFVDFDYLVKVILEPTNATPLRLKEAGSRNVEDAMLVSEACCVTTRYANAGGVHAIWEPKLST